MSNELARQMETLERLDTENSAAIHRASDLGVRLENGNAPSLLGQTLGRGQTRGTGSYYQNVIFVFNGQSFFSLTSHLPRKVIQNERQMSLRSSQKLELST